MTGSSSTQSFRMPAEWEPHDRTLMGWPCRVSSWRDTLEQGRAEFAAVANAIAAFEPVTMVCATEAEAAAARSALMEGVDVVVFPMDGSWLRDNAPIFVTNGTERIARHFRFNAWGERHADRDRDARLGLSLADHLGIPATTVDVVLEGGAISVDGAGTLVAPEGCLMHPTRNWYLTRDEVEAELKSALGLNRVVWIPEGLQEDQERDPEHVYYGTDGHIDLFFDFIAPNRCLMLSVPDDDINAETLQQSKEILEAAGIEVIDFPYMSGFDVDGRHIIAPYLNFYVCNGAVIVPVAGVEPDKDQEALSVIASHWPGREIVSVKMRAGPMQGGAIHCATKQVPATV